MQQIVSKIFSFFKKPKPSCSLRIMSLKFCAAFTLVFLVALATAAPERGPEDKDIVRAMLFATGLESDQGEFP